jgi:hypothetical protein
LVGRVSLSLELMAYQKGTTLVRIRGIGILGGVVLFLDGIETCSGISKEIWEGET